jgi:hypothetical protein
VSELDAYQTSQSDKKPSKAQKGKSKQNTDSEISDQDAFLKSEVRKLKIEDTHVFEVSYRLYTTLDVKGITKVNHPKFDNFDVLQEWIPNDGYIAVDEVDGQRYYVVDLCKIILAPNRSGTTTLSGGSIQVVFDISTDKTVDTFFGTMYIKKEVNKQLSIQPFTIDAGLVGNWVEA